MVTHLNVLGPFSAVGDGAHKSEARLRKLVKVAVHQACRHLGWRAVGR